MELNQIPLDKMTVIYPDGEIRTDITPKNQKKFTYEEIYQVIGNIIEPIVLRYHLPATSPNYKEWKKMNIIVDEEGAINGSPYNADATIIIKQLLGPNAVSLFGKVIIIPNKLFPI